MNKKSLFNALRAFISLGLIGLLLWIMRGSLGDVLLTIKKADNLILFWGFLSFVAAIILLGVRLSFIMKTQHLKISLREAVSLTFVGHFFNNFLPTSIGGDIAKAYYASRHTGKKLAPVACIILDRILGTFTLILMVLAAYFFVRDPFYNKFIVAFITVSITVSAVIFLILFSRRTAKRIPGLSYITKKFNLHEKMKGLYEIINNYKHRPKLLLNAILISVLLQIFFFYSVYIMTRGLHFSIPLIWVFLIMPIISTASMAPSINGLGVRESAFVLFFSPMMGKEGAFALGILWLAMNLGVSLIGGIIYFFKMPHRHKEADNK